MTTPLRSLLPWIDGKYYSAQRILSGGRSPACKLRCLCRTLWLSFDAVWSSGLFHYGFLRPAPLQWEHLVASTKVYPERNAWYVDEIVHLTGDIPRLYVSTYVSAVVIVEHEGSVDSITATAAIPDEALAVLYEHVYAWSCEQLGHALQRAS